MFFHIHAERQPLLTNGALPVTYSDVNFNGGLCKYIGNLRREREKERERRRERRGGRKGEGGKKGGRVRGKERERKMRRRERESFKNALTSQMF